MRILFIASPAAGKGTQAKKLCHEYHLVHIEAGAILRNEISNQTELGKMIEAKVKKGIFIDNETMLKLMEKKLEHEDSYILDGFPRNLCQAKLFDQYLSEHNIKLDYVFYLTVSKELARKRTLGRTSCPVCKRIYNEYIDETKAKIDGICDDCNSALEKRSDDNEEVFERRYQTYLTETLPLVEYYREKGLLYEIDGNSEANQVFVKIKEVFHDFH